MDTRDTDRIKLSIMEHQQRCPVHAKLEAASNALANMTARLEAGTRHFESADRRLDRLEDTMTNVRINIGKIMAYIAGAAAAGGLGGVGISHLIKLLGG